MEEQEVEEPQWEDIEKAIKSLNNNRAPGMDDIFGEIYNYGGESILAQMHDLILQIRNEKKLSDEWSIGII